MPLNLNRKNIDNFDTRYYEKDGDGYEEPTEAIITATKVFKQTNQTTLTKKARQNVLAKTVDAVDQLDAVKDISPINLTTRLNVDEDKLANQQKQLLIDVRQRILDESEI